MELIPFLIFGVIAFNIFKSFNKATSKSGGSAKQMMRRLNEEIEKASKLQNETPNTNHYYREKTPTQRGRESLARKGQRSPWGENGSVNPGAQVASNYLKTKTQAARKASHKSPKQRGRRGSNMDQNRNRTDDWGQRGDSRFLNGKMLVILLIFGGGILFVLSNMPAN